MLDENTKVEDKTEVPLKRSVEDDAITVAAKKQRVITWSEIETLLPLDWLLI
jgi:hypothetical protein